MDMKRIVIRLISFAVMTLLSLPVAADTVADKAFANKFLSYKIKNKVSTLKTAEAFAKQYRRSTDQILNRFVRAQFSMEKNADLAVVFGLEAFQEQGHSFNTALNKVSDLTGQMTSTLEAMNNTSRFNPKRETASNSAPRKKSVASR